MKKIVLLCAAGMSTSLLVTKMHEVATKERFVCSIDAYPVSQAVEMGKDADCILLGPQVRYELNKIKGQLVEKPIAAIDMVAYGLMDGVKVLAQAKKLMGI